jgi:hypothetical protein
LYVVLNKNRTMHNIQKYNNCINILIPFLKIHGREADVCVAKLVNVLHVITTPEARTAGK